MFLISNQCLNRSICYDHKNLDRPEFNSSELDVRPAVTHGSKTIFDESLRFLP